MKKLLLPFCIFIAAYFAVQREITPISIPLPEQAVERSHVDQSANGKYYFAQVHPDDREKFALRGFPESGIYEINTKKFLAPFPYMPVSPHSRFKVLGDPTHVALSLSPIKNISDKGLVLFENGKEKFSYKVNHFCKRLKRDVYTPEIGEKLWGGILTADGLENNLDDKSQILVFTACDKNYVLNYLTGKFVLKRNQEEKLIGTNTGYFLVLLLTIIVLSILSLMSFRLKTKLLTFIIVTTYCFLLFYLSKNLFYYGSHSYYDEILIQYFS